MPETIPVNEPLLNGNEERYLNECIRTGWISSEGPFVKRLEEGFAARVGRRHGIAVANGSVALDLAFAALDIGRGDEVIVPTFTIISCAAAVLRAGAIPVFVDCDPETWNTNADRIASRFSPRTKAILAVHIYGLPMDMDPVLELARERGLWVIEDAAQMHGQTYKGRPCGGLGDLSTFSFYPNKLVTTGEGGIVVTDDSALAERCRTLRNLAFRPGQRFLHEELGWNYRLSNLQAAVGVAQLERLDEFIQRKRRIGALYSERLAPVSGLQLPLPQTAYAENIYWVFGVVLDDQVPFDAGEAMRRLAARKIGTRPFFWPMHDQPVFRKMGLFADEIHPNAERLARRGFYLPTGLALTEQQLDRVVAAVREIMQ
ncbi:DegT/DnrJ/EryC1/StrS family aminotransferase (plasmid) [Bradyrhizobium sp. ISRA443]|uniref:DegT/DnrJ/EryC1/StrS family aminotransferase n=1 Tax=unclassified Bradyrhizobium TaxID=2631580 RepID=UPI0024785471|nr:MULTISPECIES: DegT/DnrJ/EryC1/StrS family aminotransferase [unclassified Bradyrhizobium]WGR90787.1 DegT/DnrJ/EryC1/StrS family aminotransferase [Bradyrhizobium sp. ISRA435]WGS03082.1 DegT/DnrJ/EryC1/StrS family aminotransferase [Bradyrhizobium sp. ISRA436]WGS09884.1 DegT/DnrJ/EryC1/StrS family aminotransferase [Bradyrhizobium sp. ISRA437]WGS16769.1 DegT/DnrJ/EryC1/StrS family aminotransferase [Bradyrhizobium sp. ISRA443]